MGKTTRGGNWGVMGIVSSMMWVARTIETVGIVEHSSEPANLPSSNGRRDQITTRYNSRPEP